MEHKLTEQDVFEIYQKELPQNGEERNKANAKRYIQVRSMFCSRYADLIYSNPITRKIFEMDFGVKFPKTKKAIEQFIKEGMPKDFKAEKRAKKPKIIKKNMVIEGKSDMFPFGRNSYYVLDDFIENGTNGFLIQDGDLYDLHISYEELSKYDNLGDLRDFLDMKFFDAFYNKKKGINFNILMF